MKKKFTLAVMSLALALILAPVFAGQAAAQAAPICASVSGSIDGSEAIQTGRINRDTVQSTCANKAWPGIFGSDDHYYETYLFSNDTGADTCFTVNWDEGTCGSDVHASAYLNSYDPGNMSANFLGDVGSSQTQPFQFTVPAGQNFVIVVNTNFGLSTCPGYSFTVTGVDAGSCSQLNVSVPTMNEWGMIIFLILAGLTSAYFLPGRSES